MLTRAGNIFYFHVKPTSLTMEKRFDLQQEAEYVLGMMDMYPDDKEILSMLKMKGMGPAQAEKVMQLVKAEGYQKRIKQAKKIALIGLLIALALGITWVLLFSSGIYQKRADMLERVNTRMITGPVFYGAIYGVGQTFYGIYRFILYSSRLKKLKQVI